MARPGTVTKRLAATSLRIPSGTPLVGAFRPPMSLGARDLATSRKGAASRSSRGARRAPQELRARDVRVTAGKCNDTPIAGCAAPLPGLPWHRANGQAGPRVSGVFQADSRGQPGRVRARRALPRPMPVERVAARRVRRGAAQPSSSGARPRGSGARRALERRGEAAAAVGGAGKAVGRKQPGGTLTHPAGCAIHYTRPSGDADTKLPLSPVPRGSFLATPATPTVKRHAYLHATRTRRDASYTPGRVFDSPGAPIYRVLTRHHFSCLPVIVAMFVAISSPRGL